MCSIKHNFFEYMRQTTSLRVWGQCSNRFKSVDHVRRMRQLVEISTSDWFYSSLFHFSVMETVNSRELVALCLLDTAKFITGSVVQAKTLVCQLWFLDQHHQHKQGTCMKLKSWVSLLNLNPFLTNYLGDLCVQKDCSNNKKIVKHCSSDF